jgi:hypothetical protein
MALSMVDGPERARVAAVGKEPGKQAAERGRLGQAWRSWTPPTNGFHRVG